MIKDYCWFNFSDLNYHTPVKVSHFEMNLLLEGSRHIVDTYQDSAVDLWIEHQRQLLRALALCEPPDEDWVTQAVLLTVTQGLRGHAVISRRVFAA